MKEMKKVLHIISSPRGKESDSTKLSQAYLQTLKNVTVDTLNLWEEELLEFNGDKAAAKATFFGMGEMTDELQTQWDKIVEIVNRFKSADELVFSVPMWNGGIPYKLKHYIDILTQPYLTYKFSPDDGYGGLLENKSAKLFYTSGVFGLSKPESYGKDFQSTYMNWWLDMIGITDIKEVRFQPSAVTADPVGEFMIAMEEAGQLASN